MRRWLRHGFDPAIDVQGSEIQLLLEPESAEIDGSGMQLVMSGLADAAKVDDCIAAFDEGGSLSVPSVRPELSALACRGQHGRFNCR